MTRRIQILAAALLIIIGVSAGTWWWYRDARPTSAGTRSVSPTALAPRVRLHLDLLTAMPGEDAALIVRAFDSGTLQRDALEAAEKANGRRIAGTSRNRTMNTPAIDIPADWATSLSVRMGSASRPEADLPRTAAASPNPQSAVFAITAPPAGARVTATIRIGGRTFDARTTAPAAPADAAALARMRGRIAEALARPDGLRTAGAALLALRSNDPWGFYFQGAAAELSGDPAAARDAYTRAVTASAPGQEPPVLLLERLRALK